MRYTPIMYMSRRHEGLRWQRFIVNIAFTHGSEFNVGKENVPICFNVMINEKSFQTFPPIFKHF